MPVTVRSTNILFNDGTVQSTAAGAVTTTAVLNATAGASLGAVGTYAFLNNQGSPVGTGGTQSGSNLRYAGFDGSTVQIGNAPAGTWRAMGLAGFGDRTAVWLRIS